MSSLAEQLRAADPRVALAAACRLTYRRGLVHALAGNLSCRVPGGFLCTPTGCCLDEVTPATLVALAPDGSPTADGQPSSEWGLHAHLYAADPHIGAVVHTHSPAATVRAVLGWDLAPITPEAAHYLGPVPCLPPVPPGTDAVGRGAAQALGAGARAVLLGRHGAVTWGRDVRQAFYQAELLEAVCQLAAAVRAADPGQGGGDL